MLFPTTEFAIFFIIVLGGFWLLRGRVKAQKALLLVASYFFYGYWDWRFTFLLFGCTAGNYLLALWIGRTTAERGRKALMTLTLVFNLGLIAFFKYIRFLAVNGNNLLLALGLPALLPVLNVILPVGISFFTFQAMSYTIDVYRGEIPPTLSFFDVLLYTAFFPQLVAGPIVRGKDFLPQIAVMADNEPLEQGRAYVLIMQGLLKKVVIANYLATLLVDPVFANPARHSGIEVLLGVYGYAVQIFCDFSAYSDIAIGVALLFGFRFMDNFDNPYRAATLQDFWRRWHISLSTWLKDYLYIPLGGNRRGRVRTYVNLSLTMLLGGLWHGASWNFVIWGGMHGALLAVERFFRETGVRLRVRRGRALPEAAGSSAAGRAGRLLLGLLGVLFTFHFVCATWVFFRSPNLEIAGDCFTALFGSSGAARPAGFAAPLATPFVVLLLVVGIAMHFLPKRLERAMARGVESLPLAARAIVLGLGVWLVGLMSPEGVAPFIYFQF